MASKKENAKALIKYCLSTFDNAETPGFPDETKRKKEIETKQEWIMTHYDDRVKILREHFKSKIFNDSIHKTVELNPVEIAIIQTPEFFRLKNIKQLGGACHVYPGAVHTRFEHSIGVCHLAGEFIKNLQQKNMRFIPGTEISEADKLNITHEEEMCVRLAGLCHDLGHGPFSHLFEEVKADALGVKSLEKWKKDNVLQQEYTEKKLTPYLKHEELSILVFKWILVEHTDVLITFVEYGLDQKNVEMIAHMIDPEGDHKTDIEDPKLFLYEVVANKKSGLDVDKWDYFVRDCHHLGLTNEFDYGRTLKLSSVVKTETGERHIGFMKKEIQNIYRMFRTRCVLHQKAYTHRVVKGIEMMIADIIDKVKEEPIFRASDGKETLDQTGDGKETLVQTGDGKETLVQTGDGKETLVQILKQSVLSKLPSRDLRGYLHLTDSILDIIHNENLAQDMLKKVMCREIYWCEEDTFCEDGRHEEELKEFKKKYSEDQYECKDVKISYASEESENPLKDVYFYDKEIHLPKGEKIGIKKLEKKLTPLNMPQALRGHKIRAYCKEPKKKKIKLEQRDE